MKRKNHRISYMIFVLKPVVYFMELIVKFQEFDFG